MKKEEKKTSTKAAPKKVAKPASKAKESTPKKEASPAPKKGGKTYHVSKDSSTNKWKVKAANGGKAVKKFNTQQEALGYAQELSEKQKGSVRLHTKKGKMRKAK